MRKLFGQAVAAAVLLWGSAAPAYAHGGVQPALHHDGKGSVWATAVWQDGHPVTEPVLATLSGHSDSGEVIAPAVLQQLPHQQGTVVRPGVLAPGVWELTLDVAAPGIGYCRARLTVGPGSQAGTLPCAQTDAAATVSGPGAGVWAAIAAAVAAILLAAWWLQRRRPAAAPWRKPRRSAPRRSRRP